MIKYEIIYSNKTYDWIVIDAKKSVSLYDFLAFYIIRTGSLFGASIECTA